MHVTTGNLNQGGSITQFSGQGPYMAQARMFRVNSQVALNTIQPGNFLNVRAMNSVVTFGSLVAQLDGFGSLTPTINQIINAGLPAHLNHPDTLANLDQFISSVMIPVLNGAFNQMTMPDLIM